MIAFIVVAGVAGMLAAIGPARRAARWTCWRRCSTSSQTSEGPGRKGRLGPSFSCGTLVPMPWIPELFSAPVLERLQEKWERERLEAVPYYDGLMAGEHDALIRSFAGEPVLHDPLTGGSRARGHSRLT